MSFVLAAFGNFFLGHQLFLCWQIYWLFSFLTSLLHLILSNIKASLLNTNLTEWEKERGKQRSRAKQCCFPPVCASWHQFSCGATRFSCPPAIPSHLHPPKAWFFKLVGSPSDHCYFVNTVIMFIPMTQKQNLSCLMIWTLILHC